MQPVVTDAELLRSFTALKYEFKEWFDGDEYQLTIARANVGGPTLQKTIQTIWPEIDNVFELWNIWFKMWVQRHWQLHPVTDKDFKESIRRTRIQNTEDLGLFLLTLNNHDVDIVNLGESKFGGTVAGFAISLTESAPEIESLSGVLNALNKRFREASGFRHGDTHLYNIEHEKPYYYLKIGILQYCTGQAWTDVRNHYEHEPTGYRIPYKEGTFKDTGFSVMVKIDEEGYPSEEVCAAFNPRLESRVVHAAPGPLYKEGRPEFFMAKISDKLEDLKKYAKFKFEIIL
ncbi:hypothetical protein B0J13DRAFT_523255 [Dactylonectria estremocensis]|uniref:Uncharacterized protein n=1 Tax=Dactylonectria estremocensis TaxID=1079267 RepID=A0A9P9J9B0_9HYPO|nr:hypothetical protein B0J13DRAFT_523255 [Dactylonectria estremocensis]